jgi:hypothetical protein
MYQGFADNYPQLVTEVIAAGLDVSLCTIQQSVVAQDADGAPQYTPPTNVAGLINIPCMNAPLSADAVQATEVRDLEEIQSKGLRHVLLMGYYPQITADLWALVDGVTYDIMGVESDSQTSQTRLKLQLASVGGTAVG